MFSERDEVSRALADHTAAAHEQRGHHRHNAFNIREALRRIPDRSARMSLPAPEANPSIRMSFLRGQYFHGILAANA
jgi:hypothetical protein